MRWKILGSTWMPAITLSALIACESRDGIRVVFSDSAGVQIVDNIYPTWGDSDRWRLGDAPVLQIGVAHGEAEYELHEVRAARRLSNGQIVVANHGTSELRFYDHDGRFLHGAGRAGAGPGEFEALARVYEIAAGSLLVADAGLGRLSVFDVAGNFVHAWNPTDRIRLFWPLGHFWDGSVLLSAAVVYPQVERQGVYRDMASYYRYSAEGSLIDSLGMFPFTERYFSTMPGGVYTRIERPFGLNSCTAVGDTLLYFGTGERFEIAVYSPDGILARLQRYATRAIPLTNDHIEQYMSTQSELRRRILEGVPFPSTLPAYSRFVVDGPGNLWVEEFRLEGVRRSRWWVFDSRGRLLGSVDIQSDLRVQQIGNDFVLATWRDEDGVEFVRIHDLIKPSE